MGLTAQSTGLNSMDTGITIAKNNPDERIIAIGGNPNVGKSTVFNALTNLNQHTGNWPGKTVTSATGCCSFNGRNYWMVDIPGTYSLFAHSAEEEVARDFLCFGGADAAVVVCDATCLERNLNLVLQTIEILPRTVVCINLMDEAEKKKIRIDLDKLENLLGVPVVAASAREGKGMDALMEALESLLCVTSLQPVQLKYPQPVEQAVSHILPETAAFLARSHRSLPPRWAALQLLQDSLSLNTALLGRLGELPPALNRKIAEAQSQLAEASVTPEALQDKVISSIFSTAEQICKEAVHYENPACNARDRKIDRLLTSRKTGLPAMLLLLAFIFWLTISGANYPSQLLSDFLFAAGDHIYDFLLWAHTPIWLCELLIMGVYRVLAWVVAVMLPPMAIFFPLFTILEDLGYLPRIAFNLDKCFQKARACGKQALTMCMGFGCNAAGVVGCRIIDSPRERLIAILTNNFVPCNGRLPTLIAIISMFFVSGLAGPGQSVLSALMLTAVILLGVLMTLACSRLLSATLLKGVPSSFTLELPPYRRPQIGKVIVRSILDRTLFVLGRAAAVAAPAGLLLWLLANLKAGDLSLLQHCANFLDPFAHLLGLDGVILLAFILGFPANEIVVPIIIMAYMATGNIMELDTASLHTLLVNNGWTWLTALCTMLFSLFHWPCSTTCLTINKETQSFKWTLAAVFLPTACGMLLCFLTASAARIFGLA